MNDEQDIFVDPWFIAFVGVGMLTVGMFVGFVVYLLA